MNDDRLSRYLLDRAVDVDLGPGDVDAVVRRAGRRRRTRRGLAAAGVAATVAAAAVVIVPGGDGDAPETVMGAPTVAESPFDWAVAESSSGLTTLLDSSAALTDDGSVYVLSTAPGPQGPETLSRPRTLYRSADGADWAPVAVPDDFWPVSLAGTGDQLYAVGTAPAGGGVADRLATSGDGGATWSTAEIDTGLSELEARYPGEIYRGRSSVAVDGDRVVVARSVQGVLDLNRVPGLGALSGTIRTNEDGVVVTPVPQCGWADGDTPTTSSVPPDPAATEAARADADAAPAGADQGPAGTGRGVPECGEDAESESGSTTYTWQQLGVDDELRELVLRGRTVVSVSVGGGEFTTVDVGSGTTGSQVVATDDGFALFTMRVDLSEPMATPVTEVLRSADGQTWEPAGELDGHIRGVGVIGGRAAVALDHMGEGGGSIHLAQPDGSWLTVDPGEAVGRPGGYLGSVAFGPLGWAAVVYPEVSPEGEPVGDDPDERKPAVVHSVDGTTISAVPLSDVIDPAQRAGLDVTVTADAVLVRVSEPDDGDVQTVPAQRVVVGTPAA